MALDFAGVRSLLDVAADAGHTLTIAVPSCDAGTARVSCTCGYGSRPLASPAAVLSTMRLHASAATARLQSASAFGPQGGPSQAESARAATPTLSSTSTGSRRISGHHNRT